MHFGNISRLAQQRSNIKSYKYRCWNNSFIIVCFTCLLVTFHTEVKGSLKSSCGLVECLTQLGMDLIQLEGTVIIPEMRSL